MLDYETLRFIWWALLGALLIGFAITDGFDMGVGALFRFLGHDDVERRAMLEAVEPVWEGNQVWFVLGGGAMFAAWPTVYATSFSGFYFAMFLILLALILRPVGFTYRNKLENPRWRNVWDWALFIGGALPALLFGVAFGNLFLGLPFHFDALMRPTYTGGFFELLHPFALLCGVVSLSMLAMHGATYLTLKLEQPLAARTAAAGRWAALLLIGSFCLAGLWLAFGIDGMRIDSAIDPHGPSNPVGKTVSLVSGAWLANYRAEPLLWAVPAAAIGFALLTWLLLRAGRGGLAFISSALVQASVILTAGIGLFPFLMPSSSTPGSSLTVWDSSSSQSTLFIMLLATAFFLPLILLYTSWVFRVLRGKISLEHIRQQIGLY